MPVTWTGGTWAAGTLDGQWMTYGEAAVRLGVTPEAVREAHIVTLKTDLERLTVELAGERAGRQGEVELLKGQLVTERERADRAVTDLTGERAARQADQEQLAAARAAADRAMAELVELARRLAAIAETQTSAGTAEAEPEPPRRSKLGRARGLAVGLWSLAARPWWRRLAG
jgi:type II secretory pathway component PulL